MQAINHMAAQELNVLLQMPFATVAMRLNQGTIPKTGRNLLSEAEGLEAKK